MRLKITAGQLYGALIIGLTAWVLHNFVEAALVACVTAVASWPLHQRFAALLSRRIPRSAASLIFTCAITLFVLAPMMFAFAAMVAETHALLLDIAAANKTGIVAPHWLEDVPLVGQWLDARWQSELAYPGALSAWMQRTEPAAVLGWARSLGHFMGRQVFIVAFAVLVLFFLYQHGEALAADLGRFLRRRIGEHVERHLELATRSLRASVNSMLIVGLFDGLGTGVAYAIAGTPHAGIWAAITGSLALVPFLGYAAAAALALQLAMKGLGTAAVVSFALAGVVLFCGDKIVRPVAARDGTRLSFVWGLMGCLGGFKALGLVGLVIGPVVLTLARDLWQQAAAPAPS